MSAKADCECVSPVRTTVKIRTVAVTFGSSGGLGKTFTLDNAQVFEHSVRIALDLIS